MQAKQCSNKKISLALKDEFEYEKLKIIKYCLWSVLEISMNKKLHQRYQYLAAWGNRNGYHDTSVVLRCKNKNT